MDPTDRHIRITNGDSSGLYPETPDAKNDTQDPPAVATDAVSTVSSQLQQDLAALKHKYQQLVEDFDNFIKRTQRDAEQQATVEKESFIYNLLPIIDNLERALTSGRNDPDDPLFQGVKMTLQQLGQLLSKHGIEPVADRGRPFDPHRHEAISMECDPRQPDGIVLAVTQRGYWRGDQVFRPAKVIVNDSSRYPGAHYAR